MSMLIEMDYCTRKGKRGKYYWKLFKGGRISPLLRRRNVCPKHTVQSSRAGNQTILRKFTRNYFIVKQDFFSVDFYFFVVNTCSAIYSRPKARKRECQDPVNLLDLSYKKFRWSLSLSRPSWDHPVRPPPGELHLVSPYCAEAVFFFGLLDGKCVLQDAGHRRGLPLPPSASFPPAAPPPSLFDRSGSTV